PRALTPPAPRTAPTAPSTPSLHDALPISLAIATNPSGGTLTGTIPVAAAAGVATFTDLSIDTPGTGYTLTATSGTLTQATSNAFNITATPPPPATHLAFGVQPSTTQVGVAI